MIDNVANQAVPPPRPITSFELEAVQRLSGLAQATILRRYANLPTHPENARLIDAASVRYTWLLDHIEDLAETANEEGTESL